MARSTVKRGPGRPPGSGKKQAVRRGRPPGSGKKSNYVAASGSGGMCDLVTLTLKVLEFQSELFALKSQIQGVAQQLSTTVGNMNTNFKIVIDRLVALEQAAIKPTPAPTPSPTPTGVQVRPETNSQTAQNAA